MFRFIHAADIHLDSPLRGLQRFEEDASIDSIRGATRKALSKLVDLALDREVDFVLIAGDVYDGDWKDFNTGLYFVGQMSRLRAADIPVIMIAGNHDAANKMTKTLRLPDNVVVLASNRAETAQCQKLDQLGIAVHGRSFAQAAEQDNLAQEYPGARKGCFNIGLLHTAMEGVEGHARYAPCTLADLVQKQYDYWALGHVHQRKVVAIEPHVVFSGNIQGRHIREPDAKGCYVVTVDDQGKIDLGFESLDVMRWETCDVNASELTSQTEILDLFSTRLSELQQKHDFMPLAVRVVVTGQSDCHQSLHADPIGWKNQFRAVALDANSPVWIENAIAQTQPAARNTTSMESGGAISDGPIGELYRLVGELRKNDTQLVQLKEEWSELRQKLPSELLEGDDALLLSDPAQIRRWLDDVLPLLTDRLSPRRAT